MGPYHIKWVTYESNYTNYEQNHQTLYHRDMCEIHILIENYIIYLIRYMKSQTNIFHRTLGYMQSRDLMFLRNFWCLNF